MKMNLSKCLLICLILMLIVAICEAEIIKSTSYSSRSNIAGTSLKRFSGRVNSSANDSEGTQAVRLQRPNVAPIRPGYAARSSDLGRSHAPEATSWREPQSSQPERELIFVSQRNMRERPGSAGSNSRRRHSRRMHHHKNNSERDQVSKARKPNELPIRPEFTTERLSASFGHRNSEAFAKSDLQSSSSQQEQIFVSPPRHIRTKPDTTEDKPRRRHSRRKHHHKNNSGRDQASRARRLNEHPIPEAFERSPAAVIRIELNELRESIVN